MCFFRPVVVNPFSTSNPVSNISTKRGVGSSGFFKNAANDPLTTIQARYRVDRLMGTHAQLHTTHPVRQVCHVTVPIDGECFWNLTQPSMILGPRALSNESTEHLNSSNVHGR